MTSEQHNSSNTPGNTSHGSGLTPDAGPDTSRAVYLDVGQPDIQPPVLDDLREQADLNDSSHDDQNVDVPNPGFSDDEDTNVVNRQMGIIGRTAG